MKYKNVTVSDFSAKGNTANIHSRSKKSFNNRSISLTIIYFIYS